MNGSIGRPLRNRLAERVGRILEFLWSGWAGLAALRLLAAAWQAGHEA
jgi:NitT/TauT family transport system permease protein